MKKYIALNEKKDLISEYDIENDYIIVTYSDKSKKTIPFSLDNINCLDGIMAEQYHNYNNYVSSSFNLKDTLISLGAGASATTGSLLVGGSYTKEEVVVATLAGLGTALMLNCMINKSKAEEINDDYCKDTILMNNYDVVEQIIINDQDYNGLSKSLKNKLKDVHDCIVPLSINSIKDLSTRDLTLILWKYNQKEKEMVRCIK